MCSLAARGLWIDLIGYMHEGEPYGHLTVNGVAPTLEQVASLVGRPSREVEKAFGELVSLGVCSREGDRTISRRMVRDKTKEERDQSNGKGGGNPRLIAGVNPPVNGVDKAQKLEAREPEEKEEATGSSEPVRPRLKYPPAFEGWWLAYPKTQVMSKKEALTAWNRLSPDDHLAAVAALAKYRAFLQSKPDHPAVHACRFLSQRRFDGFAELETESALINLGFHADDGSPELDAWDAHNRATKGKNLPRDRSGGWTVPSQWPPKIGVVA
jgi:hypothetical protein